MEVAPGMLRRLISYVVGTGLLVFGVLILAGTVGFFAYGQYEQTSLASQADALTRRTSLNSAAQERTAQISSTATRTANPTATDAPAQASSTDPIPTRVTTSTNSPSILRITASAIGLDARVAESPIVEGQWVIPKFEAGHLQGTAQPGSGGNVVLAGHVQSITSGDVFASVGQLKSGDKIEVYTQTGRVTYVVRKVAEVSNDDVSVLRNGSHETLTLITCSGTWLPLQHDYSDRTVVVADRG